MKQMNHADCRAALNAATLVDTREGSDCDSVVGSSDDDDYYYYGAMMSSLANIAARN